MFDSAIMYLLTHAESLKVEDAYNDIDSENFCLFNFIKVNRITGLTNFSYKGDNCSIIIPKVYLTKIEGDGHLISKADQVYRALSVLSFIVANINGEKKSV